MSRREREISRKGQPRKPRVSAERVLEALADIGGSAAVGTIARKAGCHRNTALDRLFDCREAVPALVNANGAKPCLFWLTPEGLREVERIRETAEGRGARVDRAIEALEARAAEVEAKLAATPFVDPRQTEIPAARRAEVRS